MLYILRKYNGCYASLRSGCRRNEVISNLLQPDNVTARFQISGNPPFRIVDQFWCTPDQDGNHINMTFSQPIVMEGFFSNGATSTDNFGQTLQHYISNFSILYSESKDGPLQLYPTVCMYRLYIMHTNIVLLTFRILL